SVAGLTLSNVLAESASMSCPSTSILVSDVDPAVAAMRPPLRAMTGQSTVSKIDVAVKIRVACRAMNLEGRSAIVTGGAGGLGSATVRRLIDVGMRVAVFDRDGGPAEVP